MNGLILMEDFEKFKHGMEIFLNPPDFSVGTTPSEMIFREDKMKLIHYIPIVEKNLEGDKIMDYYGIVPGDFLNAGFLLTDPFRLMIDKYVGLFDRIECEPNDTACSLRNEDTIRNFLRMEKWIFDSPDPAGETFRQFMKDCYQKNLLLKNEMKLNGKKINLKNITMPLLNVMAEFDHLVPNDASKPLTEAVSSSDKETLVFPTGHIGILVGVKSQH